MNYKRRSLADVAEKGELRDKKRWSLDFLPHYYWRKGLVNVEKQDIEKLGVLFGNNYDDSSVLKYQRRLCAPQLSYIKYNFLLTYIRIDEYKFI